MSRDRRRKSWLYYLVVDDPYRKLVAIGLGVLLWFFIDTRITDTFTRTFPLKAPDENVLASRDMELLLIDLPADRVVVKRFLDGDTEIRSVALSFRGPRFQIDQLKSQTLNLEIEK
ncbi:MAG TPA: hypothetical protein ENI87_08975, partial [bacterium]|nr:hypothetical protein [bacterium]